MSGKWVQGSFGSGRQEISGGDTSGVGERRKDGNTNGVNSRESEETQQQQGARFLATSRCSIAVRPESDCFTSIPRTLVRNGDFMRLEAKVSYLTAELGQRGQNHGVQKTLRLTDG